MTKTQKSRASDRWQHSTEYKRLINSKRWKELRRVQLIQHPYCEQCLKEGRRRPATCVHHITEVESGRTPRECEALCFSIHNLMSLCRDCHAAIHRELRSHSKDNHQEREKQRLSQWVARLKGGG